MSREIISTKQCSTCGKTLNIDYFYYRSDTHKYRDQCKSCNKGYKVNVKAKMKVQDMLFDEGKKICSICGDIKEITEFGKDKHNKYGVLSCCKDCRKNGLDKFETRNKQTYYRVTHVYGGSREDALRIIDSKVCEICGESFDNTAKQIDHDHSTNKVRGALCCKCNLSIGGFNDDIDKIKRAIEYIKKYREL